MFGFGKKKEQAGLSEQGSQLQSTRPAGDYLVQYDRRGCIGAGVCEVVAPEFFLLHDDKKAELKGSVLSTNGLSERAVPESAFPALKQAADGCPANVIHIINLKTGEKLI